MVTVHKRYDNGGMPQITYIYTFYICEEIGAFLEFKKDDPPIYRKFAIWIKNGGRVSLGQVLEFTAKDYASVGSKYSEAIMMNFAYADWCSRHTKEEIEAAKAFREKIELK